MVIVTMQLSAMFCPWRLTNVPAWIIHEPGSPVIVPSVSPIQAPVTFHAMASVLADDDHVNISGAARDAVAGAGLSVNAAGSVTVDFGAPASTERSSAISNAAPSASVENSAAWDTMLRSSA